MGKKKQTTGEIIKSARITNELTQFVCSEKLDITIAWLSKLENDKEKPSRRVAEKLTIVLGIPLSKFGFC